MRALTRDPSSAKARDLADAGAEVVAADLDDEATLRAAFGGVHGVYLVTNYWADMSAEHEIAEAANGARAARAAGVQHLIWSTLEDTRPYLPLDDPSTPVFDGKYSVPHFDAKSEADKFFIEAGVPLPTCGHRCTGRHSTSPGRAAPTTENWCSACRWAGANSPASP